MTSWCFDRIDAGLDPSAEASERCAADSDGGHFSLIEEIFAPTVIAVAEHTHDLPAGVEREGARFTQQDHVFDFMQQSVALAAIAGVAACDKVLPGGVATARAWDDVVEGEFAGGEDNAAVLTGISVAEEDVLAREGACLVRDAAILEQPDDRRHGDVAALSVEHEAVLLFSAGDAFEHEHEGASRTANVDGLVGSIEYEDRHLQHLVVIGV